MVEASKCVAEKVTKLQISADISVTGLDGHYLIKDLPTSGYIGLECSSQPTHPHNHHEIFCTPK